MKAFMFMLSLVVVVLAACSSPEQQTASQGPQASPSVADQGAARPGSPSATTGDQADLADLTPGAPTGRPRLVDLGATACMPCKMMEPILEELRHEYEGRMDVVFIDVWKNREAGRAYGINTIPTQILYDAKGQERWRHVGFIGKEDILTAIDRAGVKLPAAGE